MESKDDIKKSGELDLTANAALETGKALKSIYTNYLLPLEKRYRFSEFYKLQPMHDIEFFAKPIVLLVGPYSVGKTSFIRHMVQRDFPGMVIGQAPTTDRFIAVYHGETEQTVSGDLLQADNDLPFTKTREFGDAFLNKFQGSVCDAPILRSFTFIDTPGVLSGKKQKSRAYDYDKVMDYFASQATIILLLFDVNKLDISDEMQDIIKSLRKYDSKLKVVLNKSDSIEEEELIRDYGSLMWYLGKVFKTPEVLKVYITSFHDIDPNLHWHPLFKKEKNSLLHELRTLPKANFMQRKSALLRRAKQVRIHCILISYLRDQIPKVVLRPGKKQQIMLQLVGELAKHFTTVAHETDTPYKEMPKLSQEFKRLIMEYNLRNYPKFNVKMISAMETVINTHIPKLEHSFNKRELGEEVEDIFEPLTFEEPSAKTSFNAKPAAPLGLGRRKNSRKNLSVQPNSSAHPPLSSLNESEQSNWGSAVSRPRGNSVVSVARARGSSIANAVGGAVMTKFNRFKGSKKTRSNTNFSEVDGPI